MLKLLKFEKQTYTHKPGVERNRIALFLGDDGSEVHYYNSKTEMQEAYLSPKSSPEYKEMLKDVYQDIRNGASMRRQYDEGSVGKVGF